MDSGLAIPKSASDFIEKSMPYLVYLKEWERALTTLDLAAALPSMDISADQVAIASVDLINGFCYEGNLASPRACAILPAVAQLFSRAWELGVTRFALVQEAHDPKALEFAEYGPHGIAGTSEALTVPELASLPFANRFTIVLKNSISVAIDTEFDRWLQSLGDIRLFLAVGVCTDLCVYDLAMHLKLRSNAKGLAQRIVVPADCVATYDIPVERAKEIGAVPHDADFLHLVFLHHLRLNGIEVVKNVI